MHTHKNYNNNGLLTVYPPNGSLPIKKYNIKKENCNIKKCEIYNIKTNNIGL